MAEGLFHHDPGSLDQAGAGQALNYAAEQRRRDLKVKDRAVPPLDGPGDAVIDLRVPEITRDHRQALREAPEHLFVDHLAGSRNGAAGVISQGRGRPLVAGHADNRARKHSAALQAVQGLEGHLLRQISGDAEDHQNIRGRADLCGHVVPLVVIRDQSGRWPSGSSPRPMTAPMTAPSCKATASPISAVTSVNTAPMGPNIVSFATIDEDMT